MKKVIPVLMIIFCVGLTAQEAEVSKDIEGRVLTKVIQLKNITLSGAYFSSIRNFLNNDYAPEKTDIQYDREDNIVIITATPITIEKIEHFLNKIDVPKQSLNFNIFLLESDNSGDFPKKLGVNVIKELKSLNVNGVKVISSPRMSGVSGKWFQFKTGQKDVCWYDITFLPTGTENKLTLEDLKVTRLIKDLPNATVDGKAVYREWKVLETTMVLEKNKPAIIGVSEDSDNQIFMIISLVD